MSKIKIGAQVTAKVRHTNVTVSGTFQGYELEDQEDPTSICGTVLHVKDGMQRLDYVYVDSIKVCKGEDEDERIRKELIEYLTHRSEVTGFIDEDKDCKRWIAYLEKQKEQKPAEWSEEDEKKIIELKTFIAQCNGFNKKNRKKVFDMIDTLRPQPHWKPSEEQMKALLSKLPVVKGSGDKVQDILESLYNDLKKLM